MRRKRFVSVLTLAVCGVLLTGGCVSAATKAAAGTPAAALPTAATGGRVNIMIYGVNNEVEARPCRPNGPSAFRAQLITVAGSGTISF